MPRVFLSYSPSKLAHYYGDKAAAALQAIADVRFNTAEADLTSLQLASLAHDCDVIVADRQLVGDEALFLALPKLKAFVRCAIDIRNVDVPAASRLGLLVTQASAGFMASVSEWIIGAMIDLSRNISASSELYHAGKAALPVMGRELRGGTLGVIGYGQISQYVCDVALALGMRVLVSDPYTQTGRPDLHQTGLTQLLNDSDYVVCLATATQATENLMNARAFAAMKPGAFFINPSRGNLVDETALLAALNAGTLGGCALDVGRGPDQMPSSQLAMHPKVIATPHIGGLTLPAIEHQALETVAQVTEIIQGRTPKGAVNGQHAFRWQQAFGAQRAA